MSDQTTEAKIQLSVEVRAAERIKALKSDLDDIAGSLKQFANFKGFSSKFDAEGARKTVETFNVGAATARKLFDIETRASRQRRTDAKAEAGERAEFSRDAVRDLREQFAFGTRMRRQQAQEEAEAARARKANASDAMASLREQFSFQARMLRQQADAAREIAREQSAALKAQVAASKEAQREQARAARAVVSGSGQVRNGIGRAATTGAVTGAVLGAGARRGLDRFTQSGVGIDEAMTQAQIHIYGQQSAGDARKSAEALRKRLMGVAVKLGSKTSDLIGAYVEAYQAGVDSDILDKVTELGSKYAKMNRLSLPNTLEESGYALQGLKAFGKITDQTVSDYFNKMSYLVATTAANRTQMSSFGKRGLAAGASVGMSPDDTLAFGAAATAAGAEGSQAARMLSSQGGRIAGWEMHARDIQGKRHKTEEDKLYLRAPQMVGFGSFGQMAAAFKKDFLGTFAKVQDGLKKIQDPLKRRSLEKMLYGQEFGSLTDGMVMGSNLRDYREKMRSPEASHFIDQNWAKQTGSFGFIVDQIKSAFDNLTDSLGLALKPMYEDLRDWAVRTPAAFDNLEASFKAGLGGFLSGLGSPDGTMAGLLKRMLGAPETFQVNVKAIGDAARGFGQGLRDVSETVRTMFQVFSGGDGSAETMGRWAGRFIGFSTALIMAAPAIAVLSGIGTALLGFATIARGVMAGLRAIGGTAAGGTGGGILTRLGLAGIIPRLLGGIGLAIVAEFGQYRGELATLMGAPAIAGMLWDGIKSFLGEIGTFLRKALSLKDIVNALKSIGSEAMPAPVERWLNGKPADGQESPAQVQRQSAGGDWHGLIHKSAFDPLSDISRNTARMVQALDGSGARVQLAGFGNVAAGFSNGNGGFSANFGGGSGGGAGPDHAGMKVPGWYGAGSNRFGGGNGVTDPRMSGDVAERAKAAHDFFRSKGLSEEATAGILASMKKESNFTPNARGDGGKAHGLFQHHADRRAQIQAATGINMSTASFGQQLEGAWWEMNHGDAGAQRALKILKSPNISAREAGGAFVQHFERPARDERGERGALAEGMMRQFGGTGGTGGQAGGVSGGGSGAAGAADVAEKFLGKDEHRNRGELSRFVGHDVAGNLNAWCARFVNASLNAVGVKGTGSAMATSFLKWGKAVDAEAVQKSDVLVEHRGHGAGQGGGHVGLATGNSRVNPRTGELELESVSGNHGDAVVKDWTAARKVAVRRSLDAMVKQAIAPAEAASAVSTRPTAADLAGAASSVDKPVRVRGMDGGSAVGGTTSISAPVTIHAGNQSPQEIAGAMQRHVSESRNFRSHDMEPELT